MSGNINALIKLGIIIPCFNESDVLTKTIPQFLDFLNGLIKNNSVTKESFLLFVDDGSTDQTWSVIKRMQKNLDSFKRLKAIRLSTNKGHQNALAAGMKKAYDLGAGGVITIDCDGQDDINAMLYMLSKYYEGNDVVYGVRENRDSDNWFKRTTAKIYYKILNHLGDKSIYNHADYRFISRKVLTELLKYDESNLYYRGIIPLIGFNHSIVYYTRQKRISGNSHYSLKRMLKLASNGITNSSTKPLHISLILCVIMLLLSMISIILYFVYKNTDQTITTAMLFVGIGSFFTFINMLYLSIIAEYIAKIHIEIKHRPLYHIMEEINTEGDST